MSELSQSPLELHEAVPLLTALAQQVLADKGLRCLAIKGPAFAALGVRRPRQSNDVDLLVHPRDRLAATSALIDANWAIISHWFPPALDDVVYSTTLRHPLSPAALDLHYNFSGLMGEAGDAFDAFWESRTTVEIAHRPIATLSREHAIVLETLNALKSAVPEQWPTKAKVIADASIPLDVDDVIHAAHQVGARHSAAPLIDALGGPPPRGPVPDGFSRWMGECGRFRTQLLFWHIVRRAPLSTPRVLWEQATLSEELARFWADAHGVTYRNRPQILARRLRRLVFGRGSKPRAT